MERYGRSSALPHTSPMSTRPERTHFPLLSKSDRCSLHVGFLRLKTQLDVSFKGGCRSHRHFYRSGRDDRKDQTGRFDQCLGFRSADANRTAFYGSDSGQSIRGEGGDFLYLSVETIRLHPSCSSGIPSLRSNSPRTTSVSIDLHKTEGADQSRISGSICFTDRRSSHQSSSQKLGLLPPEHLTHRTAHSIEHLEQNRHPRIVPCKFLALSSRFI